MQEEVKWGANSTDEKKAFEEEYKNAKDPF
jgi:hypothetical protein